jgi:hypothetical protein
MATGTVNLNFGLVSARRASAQVDVTGLSGLTSASFIEAFAMVEATADHTKDVARVDPIDLHCEFLTAASFRIYGQCCQGHTYGDRKVRWATV